MLRTGWPSCPGCTSSGCARDCSVIAAISGGCSGIGESCQFQYLVTSSSSALLERPSTASANTPPVGTGTSCSDAASRPNTTPRASSQSRHAFRAALSAAPVSASSREGRSTRSTNPGIRRTM
jgi:hypothetical protein